MEFLGIWESVFNPGFNHGEFATIESQAGLNSYKLSVKEWVAKTNAIGLKATAGRSRKLKLGSQTVELRHAPPWQLIFPGQAAGEVIRSLA